MFRFCRLIAAILFAVEPSSLVIADESDAKDYERLRHFESKIRPVLIKHCQECHSTDTEKSGGLLLDSAEGWREGGDSGAVIDAGKPESSLLMKAINYADPRLQMPPEGKLPTEVIEDFRKWIEDGAGDPRQKPMTDPLDKSVALSVEEAYQHWAYRPISGIDIETSQVWGAIVDRYVESQLVEAGIQPAPLASPSALVRRLYFDLLGLPPTVEQLEYWSNQLTDQRYGELVEHLLASPHFGETFARHWMDIVRYADSVALRGFVHKNAWRYRDYLIEAYNQDRSFQQLIREQVAGDLLPADDSVTRSRQLIATAFLALGNTNLEEQDKAQLDMDYIDEQLDVIGSAFLGQTISCARCHDHKFDPIPTRDYYALAGILKSASGMKHANVSEWIELPLPLDQRLQNEFEQLEAQHAEVIKQVQQLKKKLASNNGENQRFIRPADLPGTVVDSAQATLVGSWVPSTSVGSIVGDNYLHDGNTSKGMMSVTFEPETLPPGEYEVLLAYQHGDNRASNVVVQVFSADGDKEITVNQRLPAPELKLWFNLGRYRFEANGQKYVLVSNANTDGHVVLDAVLFLPVGQLKEGSLAATLQPDRSSEGAKTVNEALKQTLKHLETQVSEIQKKLDSRPKYLTVVESGKALDIPIHIRGDVHTLGETVPRGFLTALRVSSTSGAAPDRLQLAEWLGDNSNPLTGRVYANRVWSWLMGHGIVASTNNFGTMGATPTHPELLDWLASRLIDSGWSTKALVREIVHSQAYRRSITEPCHNAAEKDPDNRLYWRGHLRRLTVEALRDSMLVISGELDSTQGGSLIRPGTKEDYNYVHNSTRRSVYQPVFRNSLPELFDEFDFGNPSFPIDKRSRSTVAPQGLALIQEPWVIARSKQTALKYASVIRSHGFDYGLQQLYLACFGRSPSDDEKRICRVFLDLKSQATGAPVSDLSITIDDSRLEQLVQALFASLDFRFLD